METAGAIAEPRMGDETPTGLMPYRLTVSDFLHMIELGSFPEDTRVELLDGRLCWKITRKTPRIFAADILGSTLNEMLPSRWIVREEESNQLGQNWRPEPDITLVRGPRGRYRFGDPSAADLTLVIEVSDASYRTDCDLKCMGYAAAGIPRCWIVNLASRQIEVFAGPEGQGEMARYQDDQMIGEDQSVPVVIEGVAYGSIRIRDILP